LSLVYDVNLRGTTYFAHVAWVSLLQGNPSKDDRSLTIISSTAGVHCPASAPLYAVSQANMTPSIDSALSEPMSLIKYMSASLYS